MESRLREKLKLAGGVVERVGRKIEAKADAVIAREGQFDPLIDKAFAVHEAVLNDSEMALDQFEHALATVTNDPLQNSPLPSPVPAKGVGQADTFPGKTGAV